VVKTGIYHYFVAALPVIIPRYCILVGEVILGGSEESQKDLVSNLSLRGLLCSPWQSLLSLKIRLTILN